jgi:hypothetical protein
VATPDAKGNAPSLPPAQVTAQVTDSDAVLLGAHAESDAQRYVDAHGPVTIDQAKLLKETYLAKLAQLEYDTKSGRVVEAAEVAARVGAEYAEVRTKLLAIPAEQAPRINRCRNAAEVQDTLREIITRVLEALSGDEI